MMRIAVLGGGITGLACAYYAQRAGLQPTVLESTDSFGALSQRFRWAGREFDCFHSPLSRHDLALCGLLAEIGFLHNAVWRELDSSVYQRGAVRPVDRAQLLPSTDLALWERVRVALASIACSRWFHPEGELHSVHASTWLTRYYGLKTYERVWAPLLRARFGENADEVPAFVVWRLLRQLLAERRELHGYLHGGYDALCGRLRDLIVARGGTVRLGTPVRGLQVDRREAVITTDAGSESYSAAISTLSLPDLAKISSSLVLSSLPQANVEQRGIVSVVALLRRPMDLPYRVNDLDGNLGFERVIAGNQLIPGVSTGRLSPVYLMRYCSEHSEAYRTSDADLSQAARATLSRMSPTFDEASLEAIRVFRAPRVDPVWCVGAHRRRPPVRVDHLRLYMCTSAQAYPREAGSETSVLLARETVRRLASDPRT